MQGDGFDAHWVLREGPARSRPSRPRAVSVAMRDGVRLAVDVHLPPGRTGRGPAILRQTRYLRRLEARLGLSPLTRPFDHYHRTRRVFLAAGYAWVDVDVRGTGASTGAWLCPWSPDEVEDGVEILDWIVAQPWSDGRVGSLGISYDGTASDMLVAKGHRALRAIAPQFALYDVYADVAFPGGIRLSWFTERWSDYNAALDRNAFGDAMAIPLGAIAVGGGATPSPSALERLLVTLAGTDEREARRKVSAVLGRVVSGVSPVPETTEAHATKRARDRRANMNVHVVGERVTFRDDPGGVEAMPEATIDVFSPHAYRDGAGASGVPIYSYSGWRDAAYPHAAIKRFLTVPNAGSRLTIGPWIHGGRLTVVPFQPTRPASFDHDAELLSFFDEHVRGLPPRGDGKGVHYFTMVEGRWKSADAWPPPSVRMRRLHLGPGRRLSSQPPASPCADELVERGGTGTGVRGRWRCLISLVPGDYPDRAPRDAQLLHYDSEPLDADTEVTGHPIVRLVVSSRESDAHLFAYLEDVTADGQIAYVTEGQLRVSHRRVATGRPYETPGVARTFTRADGQPMDPGLPAEVTLDLLPVSWLFRRGHRVRLVLAGADRDHFEVMAPRTIAVRSEPARSSYLDLPVA